MADTKSKKVVLDKESQERLAKGLCIACGDRPVKTRGLCAACYQIVRRSVLAGEHDEAFFMSNGMLLEKGEVGYGRKRRPSRITELLARENKLIESLQKPDNGRDSGKGRKRKPKP